MFRRQHRDPSPPTGEAGPPTATPPAARLNRRERRDLRVRAAAEADLAARLARANRRLAQVSGAPDTGIAGDPREAGGVPATPPMAHPTPTPDEIEPSGPTTERLVL